MILGADGWCLPQRNCVKINVDGAFDLNAKRGGLGVIVIDDEGRVIGGFSGSCKANSEFIEKALSLRKVVCVAESLIVEGFMVVESDLLLLKALWWNLTA